MSIVNNEKKRDLLLSRGTDFTLSRAELGIFIENLMFVKAEE